MSAPRRSARRLVLRTSAKVNLVLEVLGTRQDGYHELATVLQGIDLFDRLILEKAEEITLRTRAEGLPTDERNLVVRAARLLQEASGVRSGARITLDKHIPVAAGLGGGSSDAAATLWGLNRLWRLRWPVQRLREVASRLGSDIPFFFLGGRALATGRGEILQPLPATPGLALTLVNPRFPLSTREVYECVPSELKADGSQAKALIAALASGRAASVARSLYNSLESVVEAAHPMIGRIKAALLAAGALGAVMSGSGPTVLGVARSLDHASQIRRRVTTTAWSCWAVRTVPGPAIRLVQG
ncbi:MAG: 4-(cytidine 5'-diphospho)-2-C-methyl-D-erythritol kinase [Candidatus Methylomirabilia bacterium]